MLNKEIMIKKLKHMTYEELDWLIRKCEGQKDIIGGPVFMSNKTHSQRDMHEELDNHFLDVFNKHHG